MLQLLLLISVIILETSCVCEFSKGNLTCQGEEFNNVISNFTYLKHIITELQLTDCNIKNLDREIPFPNLQNLTLSCGIQEIHPSAFTNMNRLKKLVLAGNEIGNIPVGIFKNLSNLEHLDLSNNQLRNPTKRTFQYLPKVQILKLNLNRITNVDAGFGLLKNLEQLYLQGNGLTAIIPGTLEENYNLKVLDVSGNNIDFLSNLMLESNSQLERLTMGNNSFIEVPAKFFRNTPRLSHLDFGFAQVKRIDKDLFKTVSNLTELILRGNNFVITQQIFMLEQLETLDISYMKLSNLSAYLLNRQDKIQRINLSGNKFKQCPLVLKNKHTIITLNFSRNELTEVPYSRYWWKLETIDLSYNRLQEIKPHSFNLKPLKYLYLRGNMIEYINATSFSNLQFPKLEILDLRDNRLVFLEQRFFATFPKLRMLEFVGNPWECKCLDGLLQTLGNREIDYSKDRHFRGMARVCVAINYLECNVDFNDIKKYYEEFHKN